MSRFFRRKKKEAKGDGPEKKPILEKEREPDSLEKSCIKHGRPDLYEPLSYVLFSEPRGRDVEALLSEGSALSYSIAASALLHKGDTEGARECYEKSIELGIIRKEYHIKTVNNIDVVKEIGMDWWKEEGKYEELKTKEK